MNNIFVRLHRFLLRHIVSVTIMTVLFILTSLFLVSRISFTEDANSLIPRDRRISAIAEVFSSSEFAERIIVTFSLTDSSVTDEGKLFEAAKIFYNSIRADSGLIASIDFEVDQSHILGVYDFVFDNLPLYMDDSDYERLDTILSYESIHSQIEAGYRSLISPAGFATRKFFFNDPLNIASIALSKLSSFNIDENFEVYNGYIYTGEHKHLLMFIDPYYPAANTAKNALLVDRLNDATEELGQQMAEVKVESYGGTMVAVENSLQVKRDIILTVAISILFLSLLFWFYFRRVRIILYLFFPAFMGALLSLILVNLIMGEVSVIALGIGAILLCITIDYSLHVFTHTKETNSVSEALQKVSFPVLLSAITTAAALLCVYVIKSDALKQLSLFATFGIIVSCLTALCLLPLLARNIKNQRANSTSLMFSRLVEPELHTKNYLVWGVLLLTLVFSLSVNKLSFNGDISTLNYQSKELTEAQNNLMEISAQANSAVFVFNHGKTLAEALEQSDKNFDFLMGLTEKGFAKSAVSVSGVLPGKILQQERIDKWNSFWGEEKKATVEASMIKAGRSFKIKEEAFGSFYKLLSRDFSVEEPEHFKPVIDAFLNSFINETGGEYYVASVLKADAGSKPQLIDTLMDNDDLVIFDQQLLINRLLEILKEDFNKLSLLSMIVVFVLLLFFFGRIELAIVTFLPILTGWIWTLGFMGLSGIEFNIFNIIISSLIFGLGLDYSILLVSGMIDDYKYGNSPLSRYKVSVLMSAFTTLGGFGVLVFAGHPAIRSIALVSIIGISSVLIISFIITPRLFSWLVYKGGKKRLQALTLADALLSALTFSLFVMFAFILTLIVPFLALAPVRKKHKKAAMTFLISIFSKLIVALIIPVRKSFINKAKADFSKPSVIISNHQSHLDLVLLLMQHPKIIVFTNRWVYNNMFYGLFIRFADYFPAFKGVDEGLDKLREKIAEGYSILIFPEGKRSPDGSIGRFHQGAFAIAHALNIDIQPLMIHGAYNSLPKSEFVLRPGRVSLKFFDRISPKGRETPHGISFLAQAKEVTAIYREEFSKLRSQLETPDFVKSVLIHRYIYKGPVLEWYMRVKLRLEKEYRFFNDIIPRKALVVDVGCGYGFLSGMLALTSPERQLIGVDYDEEKIALAQNSQGQGEQVSFRVMDIAAEALPVGEVYIFSDVLHYLPEIKQKELLEGCMKRLPDNGMIIIRDADTDLKRGTFFTKLSEFFSTRLLGFNRVDYGLTFVPGSLVKDLASRNNLDCKVYDNAYLATSNITYVITRHL